MITRPQLNDDFRGGQIRKTKVAYLAAERSDLRGRELEQQERSDPREESTTGKKVCSTPRLGNLLFLTGGRSSGKYWG